MNLRSRENDDGGFFALTATGEFDSQEGQTLLKRIFSMQSEHPP